LILIKNSGQFAFDKPAVKAKWMKEIVFKKQNFVQGHGIPSADQGQLSG
jgi:hypothetical protein